MPPHFIFNFLFMLHYPIENLQQIFTPHLIDVSSSRIDIPCYQDFHSREISTNQNKLLHQRMPNLFYIELHDIANAYSVLHCIMKIRFTYDCFGSILSCFVLPQFESRVYFEIDLPENEAKVISMLKKIKIFQDIEISLYKLSNQNTLVENYFTPLLLASLRPGKLVRIHHKTYHNDAAQVIDVNIQKQKVLLKLKPRIDYPRLKQLKLDSQSKLNSIFFKSSPESIPKHFFEEKAYPTNKTKLKISWAKNGEVDAVEWDDEKYVGRFLYKTFSIKEIKICSEIKEKEKEMFYHELSSFEEDNPNFINDDVDNNFDNFEVCEIKTKNLSNETLDYELPGFENATIIGKKPEMKNIKENNTNHLLVTNRNNNDNAKIPLKGVLQPRTKNLNSNDNKIDQTKQKPILCDSSATNHKYYLTDPNSKNANTKTANIANTQKMANHNDKFNIFSNMEKVVSNNKQNINIEHPRYFNANEHLSSNTSNLSQPNLILTVKKEQTSENIEKSSANAPGYLETLLGDKNSNIQTKNQQFIQKKTNNEEPQYPNQKNIETETKREQPYLNKNEMQNSFKDSTYNLLNQINSLNKALGSRKVPKNKLAITTNHLFTRDGSKKKLTISSPQYHSCKDVDQYESRFSRLRSFDVIKNNKNMLAIIKLDFPKVECIDSNNNHMFLDISNSLFHNPQFLSDDNSCYDSKSNKLCPKDYVMCTQNTVKEGEIKRTVCEHILFKNQKDEYEFISPRMFVLDKSNIASHSPKMQSPEYNRSNSSPINKHFNNNQTAKPPTLSYNKNETIPKKEKKKQLDSLPNESFHPQLSKKIYTTNHTDLSRKDKTHLIDSKSNSRNPFGKTYQNVDKIKESNKDKFKKKDTKSLTPHVCTNILELKQKQRVKCFSNKNFKISMQPGVIIRTDIDDAIYVIVKVNEENLIVKSWNDRSSTCSISLDQVTGYLRPKINQTAIAIDNMYTVTGIVEDISNGNVILTIDNVTRFKVKENLCYQYYDLGTHTL